MCDDNMKNCKLNSIDLLIWLSTTQELETQLLLNVDYQSKYSVKILLVEAIFNNTVEMDINTIVENSDKYLENTIFLNKKLYSS